MELIYKFVSVAIYQEIIFSPENIGGVFRGARYRPENIYVPPPPRSVRHTLQHAHFDTSVAAVR